jgi:hypothetical protein
MFKYYLDDSIAKKLRFILMRHYGVSHSSIFMEIISFLYQPSLNRPISTHRIDVTSCLILTFLFTIISDFISS